MNQSNPFQKNYCDFQIQRLIACYDEEKYELHKLPLHELYESWEDIDLVGQNAFYCRDFVLVDGTQLSVPTSLFEKADDECVITAVIYRLTALQCNKDSNRIHLGDFECKEEARALISNLVFDTRLYGRFYEIDLNHLTRETFYYMYRWARYGLDKNTLFDVFEVPGTAGFAVKLIDTPWSEDHLLQARSFGIEQLKQYQIEAGVPDVFINLLMLAGQANVRLIIFDKWASTLQGLPVYQW